MAETKKEEREGREYYPAEGLELTFVDNLGAIYSDDRFVLSFFQSEPPLVIPEGEPNVEARINKCVARFVVTPKAMRNLVATMNQALQGYQFDHEKVEQGDE